MIRTVRRAFAALAAALLLLLFAGVVCRPNLTAQAADLEYGFSVLHYEVDMNVGANREIAVTERITASLTGYRSHGIIRDFPLGAGVRYKDLHATCDNPDFSPYLQTDDSELLSLYLRGDALARGETRTYTIAYTMIVPELKEEGYLPLDVIGYGWQTEISNVSVRVTVPDGLTKFQVYSGEQGSSGNADGVLAVKEGNTLLLSCPQLSQSGGISHGITLDLSFSAGVLSTSFDSSILIALGLAALLLISALLVLVFVCRQPVMTTTVNLSAPEDMDPLLMGKFIDNKVDQADLGAYIFYLADKGYLTIEFDRNGKRATLRRTEKAVPPTPGYLSVFYNGLFAAGDTVTTDLLTNSFYRTAQSVAGGVELAAGKLYSARGKWMIALFAALTLLLCGGFAALYTLISLKMGFFYWAEAVSSAIAFAVSCAGSVLVRQREYKWAKGKKIAISASFFLLSLLAIPVALLFKSPVFGSATAIILTVAASLTGGLCGRFLTRTKEFSARLGQILGFKQFILFTERDKIEFMLKEDPELYYHILPYAQVLGVTDAWTDKFKGLTLEPPAYAQGIDVFDVMLWNVVIRNTTRGFASAMVSRPSQSSHNGGFGGGIGGGFGGGGFGGGGGRGC